MSGGALVSRLRGVPYRLALLLLAPLNAILARLRANAFEPGSVLHVSYMGHVPHHTVEVLRQAGVRADYLAVGDSPIWDRSDYRITGSHWPFVPAVKEFLMLWRVMARYEIITSWSRCRASAGSCPS
jgi:hypothetical protein